MLSMQPMHVARAQLLARIQRRYQTITETHSAGPLRLAFTRVADPNRVLDQICEEEDRRERATGERREGTDLHLPYWAELWESAVGIGAFLTNFLGPGVARDAQNVLDLGCGMGFSGMVAAAMGANVLFADLEPDALLFAQLNSLPWSAQIRTRRVNWQKDQLNEKFDLILGADVLYDRKEWEHLHQFFRAHLNPQGTVMLGEPGRQTGEMFPAWIQEKGWVLQQIQQPLPTRDKAVRIFQLRSGKK